MYEEVTMKLAQALMDRSDMQNKLYNLKTRILNNLKVQEGQDLIEDPAELLEEYQLINQKLISLVQAINRTNSATQIEQYDMTIAEALVKKEQLLALKTTYQDVVTAATNYQTRMTRNEIKFVNVVDVKKVQKMSDDISKEYRLLDAKIQEVNWLTELAD